MAIIKKKISVKTTYTEDEPLDVVNIIKAPLITPKNVSFVLPEKIPDKTKQQIRHEDISNLKKLVLKQERHLNNSKNTERKSDLSIMRKILDKYGNETFYLTYKTENLENKKVSYNWKLYTETEFRTKFEIHKDFDLSKICYSNGEKLINNIKYPLNYKSSAICYDIEHLAFRYKNLQYVHPKLFKYANILCDI